MMDIHRTRNIAYTESKTELTPAFFCLCKHGFLQRYCEYLQDARLDQQHGDPELKLIRQNPTSVLTW